MLAKKGGPKRYLVVDMLGLVIAVVVPAGSIQYRDAVKLVLRKLRVASVRLLSPGLVFGPLVWKI
jgi:hypothetical protein